jgi:hypothetical protein
MKYAILAMLAVLITGCAGRNAPESIAHGMKWSIAQRELEQNRWQSTLVKSGPAVVRPGNGGNAYRYLGPKGETVDIVTEQVGDIEKIYRIFDGNGKELDSVTYR